MPNDVINAAIIGGSAAAIVAGIATTITTYLSRKSEERIQLRTITLNAAIAHWNHNRDWVKFIYEKTGACPDLPSLDVYIIQMAKIAELVSSKKITKENVEVELSQIQSITEAALRSKK